MNRRSFLSIIGLSPVAAIAVVRSGAIAAPNEPVLFVYDCPANRWVPTKAVNLTYSCRWGTDENGKSYLIESHGGEA